jgi:hypothetical protein
LANGYRIEQAEGLAVDVQAEQTGATAASTAPAKAKRARRNTPAEEDLAVTRAKAGIAVQAETAPAKYVPRKKKTGRA